MYTFYAAVWNLQPMEIAMESFQTLAGPVDLEKVAAGSMLDLWKRLRNGDGRYPIILGRDDDIELLSQIIESCDSDRESILAAATPKALASYVKSAKRDLAPVDGEDFEVPPRGEFEGEPIGEHDLILCEDPEENVHYALIEAAYGYEVFADLGYGDWNACPPPEIHVAQHKKWFDQYGAEPFYIGSDSVECVVARPPTTKEQAYELAEEQFWYANDNIDQGVGTLDALAAMLLNGHRWYFWWD